MGAGGAVVGGDGGGAEVEGGGGGAAVLEGAPTLAVHARPKMKLVPITVMVLLTYADLGVMDAADIGARLPQREMKDKEDTATATGVVRGVIVPSPSCKKKPSRHLQPEIHLPRNKPTAPSKTTTSITWPLSLRPQHETAPPLDSAQE